MAHQRNGCAVASRLIFAGIIAVLCFGVGATDYNVGGGDGAWAVPSSSNGLNYQQWASSNTYKTGDRLIFNYDPAQHSVLRVTPEAFGVCNFTNPIETYSQEDGDLDVELEDAEMYYFICGVRGHCTASQKFNVEVQRGAAVAFKYSVSMIAAVVTFGIFLQFL